MDTIFYVEWQTLIQADTVYQIPEKWDENMISCAHYCRTENWNHSAKYPSCRLHWIDLLSEILR